MRRGRGNSGWEGRLPSTCGDSTNRRELPDPFFSHPEVAAILEFDRAVTKREFKLEAGQEWRVGSGVVGPDWRDWCYTERSLGESKPEAGRERRACSAVMEPD